jgi:hypothetical protein
MTFSPPPDVTGGSLSESLFVASLPSVKCDACGRYVPRRQHRVRIRASWRDHDESICTQCWRKIMEWAARFALRQLELPLG